MPNCISTFFFFYASFPIHSPTVRPSTITAPRTLNDGSYRHTTSPLCIPAIIWFSFGCHSTENGVDPRGNACE